MNRRKIAKKKDCTLDKVEILDSRAIPDTQMLIELGDFGFASFDEMYDESLVDPYNEIIGNLETLEPIIKNLVEYKDGELNDKPVPLTSTREDFENIVEALDIAESTFSVNLEDMDSVLYDTGFSFDSEIKMLQRFMGEMIALTEEPKVFSIYKDPTFVAEAEARRQQVQDRLLELESDMEEAENDYYAVLDRIGDFYETGRTQEGDEIVQQIRKLKKLKNKASRNQRSNLNAQRRVLNEQLKRVQSDGVLGLRSEQETLWQEMADMDVEFGTLQQELGGDEQMAARGFKGVGELLAIYDKIIDILTTISGKLDKVLDKEKASQPKKINIPYEEAAVLLMYTEGYRVANVSIFLQRALLGNGCLTRQEWQAQGMFKPKYWQNLMKTVVGKYESKYGDINGIAEAIKDYALHNSAHREFQQFVRNPTSFR